MKKTFVFISVFCMLSSMLSAQTNTELRIDSLTRAMTLDEKLDLFRGNWTPHDRGTHDLRGSSVARLGINPFKIEYATQGVHTNGKSTLYPSPLAQAACFDEKLVKNIGYNIGMDCRARGIDAAVVAELSSYHTDTPSLQARTYGDNVQHIVSTVCGIAEGLRQAGVIPIASYESSNQPLDVHQIEILKQVITSESIDAIMLRGTTKDYVVTEDQHLTQTILRKECGFKGLLIADIWQTRSTLPAFQAGIDLDLPKGEWMNANLLRQYVENGQISESQLNDRVSGILSFLRRNNLTSTHTADRTIPENRQESSQIALEAAQKSLTLIRNEKNILPLSPKDRKIVVIGNRIHTNSESSDATSVYPFSRTTVFDALYTDPRFDILPFSPEKINLLTTGEFFANETKENQGLNVDYFNNLDFEGLPALSRLEPMIDYSWGEHAPAKGVNHSCFSVRWHGFFIPATNCIASFSLSGSGICRLKINGKEVSNNSGSARFDQGNIYLFEAQKQKVYKIEVEFIAQNNTPDIQLTYTSIPAERIQHRLREASKILVCVGSNGMLDNETGFWLDFVDKYRKKTIVIMQSCDINGLSSSTRFAGFVMAWHAGESAGQAIADLLFGKIRPTGRMPVATPEYPFGFSLTF